MIERVIVENFKRFERQEFVLEPVTVLAGPNNSGKTTLIQALSAWAFGLMRWRAGPGAAMEAGRPRRRIGQPITRKDFTALPLGHFNLLWHERATNWRNKDREGGQEVAVGRPRPIRIAVKGRTADDDVWALTMEFRYQGPEQIYANPLDSENLPPEALALALGVTHCPAFSGIGAEEPRFDPGYRNLRIGEGKPGDVLRNLLLDISEEGDGEAWDRLAEDIDDLFRVRLKHPEYDPSQPFIRCEYEERGGRYELASGGGGFHQALLLFAFIHARRSAVLLVDEPDAHLHVWLQGRVFDRLRALARDRDCQLVLATHAETILDAADPEQIVSFVGRPHPLAHNAARDEVLTAIRHASPLDLLLAEQSRGVLYCEDESDGRILEAWAKQLDHPARRFFDNPFLYPLGGRRARDARQHLFGLRAADREVRGLLLLDSDNRPDRPHDVRAEGLDVHIWTRYEIENYLLVPTALERFLRGEDGADLLIREVLRRELPASAIDDPLRDSEALIRIPASKSILPQLFEGTRPPLRKADCYRIAEAMKPEEIHPEVVQVLDRIAALLPKDAEDS